jgi:ribose-phosphate pyrophosphokinase
LGRCDRFRTSLLKQLRSRGVDIGDIEILIFDKLRVDGHVRGGRIIGDVDDSATIAYDDMMSTFGTMHKACAAVEKHGGKVAAIVGTHGLFCGKANQMIDSVTGPIVVADTVSPWRLSPENSKKVHVVSTTKMVADAIWRIHSGTGSLSELLR